VLRLIVSILAFVAAQVARIGEIARAAGIQPQ
jgi:hypothetical protein